jgi:predicted PurR-regulated permease PerM
MTKANYTTTARWFFIAIAAVVLFLFWRIFAPYAMTVLTAGTLAIAVGPIERHVRRVIKSPRWSALFMVIATFLVVVIPFFFSAIAVVDQAVDIVQGSVGEDGWLNEFKLSSSTIVQSLPASIRLEVEKIDLVTLGQGAAAWTVSNIGSIFSSTVAVIMHTIILFIAFYYILVDRERIKALAFELSPFRDRLDNSIVQRMIVTVRAVVMSAIVISIIKGILAAVGMTIFGVPGALLWGALTAVAAQIPLFGSALIMIPATIYLLVTGHDVAAFGLLIWSVLLVGLADNFLSPYIVGGRTNMHPFLILISILGGLEVFGAIGFIVGPVILAGLLVVVDLYKNGILEKAA